MALLYGGPHGVHKLTIAHIGLQPAHDTSSLIWTPSPDAWATRQSEGPCLRKDMQKVEERSNLQPIRQCVSFSTPARAEHVKIYVQAEH